MGTRIPSVRGAEQPSDGSGRERDAGRPDPPLHRPSGFPWSPFPSPYIIEQIPGASREPPMPRGVQPVFSRRVGQPGRGGRPVVSRCVARRSGATASPFRRNGIGVPAQRHHRSGATASPFRRNDITVPAQRHHRSGATGGPSRRTASVVCGMVGGFRREKMRTERKISEKVSNGVRKYGIICE